MNTITLARAAAAIIVLVTLFTISDSAADLGALVLAGAALLALVLVARWSSRRAARAEGVEQ